MLLVMTNAAKGLIAGGGFAALATPRVDLFTAIAVAPHVSTVWADLTIAAYTGYPGPVTVTISAAYISHPSGLYAVDISDATFNGPSSGAGVNAAGMVFHDTTATPIVYGVALFDSVLPLQVPLDRVVVDSTLLLDVGIATQVAN